MMKKALGLYLVVVLMLACTSDDGVNEPSLLLGEFIEVMPDNGRVELTFNTNNQLIQTIEEEGRAETYTYRLLSENQLELSCNACGQDEPSIVWYKVINDNSFEIGAFCPENSDVIMTFQRN